MQGGSYISRRECSSLPFFFSLTFLLLFRVSHMEFTSVGTISEQHAAYHAHGISYRRHGWLTFGCAFPITHTH